ncbi:MAG: ATP-binding protein [Candidatus Binatia bacterium]
MIRRHIETELLAALADTPVTLLVGARQTGKSTLCQTIAAGPHPSRYVTFDDAAVLAAARSDPEGFIGGLEDSVVIDEIQRAPEIFSPIKIAVDRDRRPGRFLLTGSANVLLLPKVADSLAGRMQPLTLWPFSQGEIAGTMEGFVDGVFARALPKFRTVGEKKARIVARVIRGGYPEVVARADPARRRAWFGSYITTILQRDIRDLAAIKALASLPRLLALIATRTTALLNYADLARSAAMPQSTLKRYLALFENTFLVRTIPAWSANLGKRLTKSPRLILADTGLLAHLVGMTEERLREQPSITGPLLENFAAIEILKQTSWSRTRASLYHFRTTTGQKVDLVLESDDGRLVGIEIKAAASVAARDFSGLNVLRDLAPKRFIRGIVLYTGTEAVPFGKSLYALPIDTLWAPHGT